MANDFKPTVGGKVGKKEAEDWIAKYDREHRKEKDKDTKSVFFGRDVIEQILSTGCAGISFFLALKPSEYAKKDVVALVMVPTREDGSLIWNSTDGGGGNGSATTLSSNGETAYDQGNPCPPYCPKQA
jgi:hypothetical protein